MTKKLFLLMLLPLAGAIIIYQLLFKTETTGLSPVDSVFSIQYQDRTENSLGTQQALLQGYINYFATLNLKVASLDADLVEYQAVLDITSLDSKPSLLEPIAKVSFSFSQSLDGLIKQVSLAKDASDSEYSMVLNLLTNFSHKLFGESNRVIKQEMFDGESWTRYTVLPIFGTGKRISFKYQDDKKWKVSGGGNIDLENAFYSEISAKYKKTMTLYDKSRQTRSVQFEMTLVDGQKPNLDGSFKNREVVLDTLKGEVLINRFKLEEMKNLIWAKSKQEIRKNFYVQESDGQPWYEYMAYYYVHKDERHELTEAFREHPGKRGDIMLALASMGDEEAQQQMLDIIESVDDEGKEDFLRYGIFLERPNDQSIETYRQYSDSTSSYANTAEKILASMYHKYANTDKYDQDVGELIGALSDSNISDQRHRFSVLGNLGSDQVLEAVQDDLNHTDEDIERLAIDALRFNEDDASKKILTEKAGSLNPAVRLSALESLRGDYFEDAFEFYNERMSVEGNKDNRIQLLKNIYDIRNTNEEYKEIIYDETRKCAYKEICTVANKMLQEY